MEEVVKKDGYTLGIDVGIASVGVAALGESQIYGLYVRTFEKAETPDRGKPYNLERREKRSARRGIRRKVHRMLRLRRLLKNAGLISSIDPINFLSPESPWELRSRGLRQLLSPQEWATVINHIMKRRGFLSTRKSEQKENEEVGALLEGISKTNKLCADGGWETLGEMFHKDKEFSVVKRNKSGNYNNTVSRLELSEELRLLFKRQRDFANDYASKDLEEKVYPTNI